MTIQLINGLRKFNFISCKSSFIPYRRTSPTHGWNEFDFFVKKEEGLPQLLETTPS